MVKDRGATLRLGGGGGGLTEYWGEGGKIYFFLLTLYNFKNIGGRDVCPPCTPPPIPRSLMVNHRCCRRCSQDMCLKTLQWDRNCAKIFLSQGLVTLFSMMRWGLPKANSSCDILVRYWSEETLFFCHSLVMPKVVVRQRKLWTLFRSPAIKYPSDKFVIRSTKC